MTTTRKPTALEVARSYLDYVQDEANIHVDPSQALAAAQAYALVSIAESLDRLAPSPARTGRDL